MVNRDLNPVLNLKSSAEWFEQPVKVHHLTCRKSVTEEQMNV